ncbi:uncharacterized protein LOC132753228 [Ruditapes philippinarum]|uniref:uncharacterized protein LOC132753228 n=1 Tax=Ruditapes philippinarum TaxID=129788 RepID=UPI00295A762E|nr:uncharacterized protein LOC132753228 [Ruditapes philippinarum]
MTLIHALETWEKDWSMEFNPDVWHGHADILVKRSVVKVVSEENDSNEEDGSSKQLQKKMRTESIEDDESSESGEDYDSSVEKGEKMNAISDHALSQILAQTIVNAFAEVSNNQKLFSSFIPSFIATSKVIRITMYNCKLDSLIMTDYLDIFKVIGPKRVLNLSTIFKYLVCLEF